MLMSRMSNVGTKEGGTDGLRDSVHLLTEGETTVGRDSPYYVTSGTDLGRRWCVIDPPELDQ